MNHIVELNTWEECQLSDYVGYLETDGCLFKTYSAGYRIESCCPINEKKKIPDVCCVDLEMT